MKKVLFASLAALAALTSCQTVTDADMNPSDKVSVTLMADAVEMSKTSISYDAVSNKYIPKWSANDKAGVFFNMVEGTPVELTNADEAAVAAFTGEVASTAFSSSTEIYAFYPASAFKAVENTTDSKVRMTIPENQVAGTSSFDKNADILLASTQVGSVSGNSVTVDDMAFTRQLAVVKITLKNLDPSRNADTLKSVQLSSSAAYLCGEYIADLSASTGAIDASKAVKNVTVSMSSPCLLSDSVSVYALVNPATLTAGSTMDLTVNTSNGVITRTGIAVSSNIALTAGHVRPLTFSLPKEVKTMFIYFWNMGAMASAHEMTCLGGGKFTWTGNISADDLWNMKFCTERDYWSGYFRDSSAEDYWTLKETSTECMFHLANSGFTFGTFTINVDTNTMKVEIVPCLIPVGCVQAGWSPANGVQMTYEGNGVFTWEGYIWNGQLEFATSTSSSYKSYHVKTTSTPNTWSVVVAGSGGDTYLSLSQFSLAEGTYKITLNIKTWTVSVQAK